MPRVGARMWMSASGASAGATPRRLVKRQARPGDLDDGGVALPRDAQRGRGARGDGDRRAVARRRASRRRTSPCRSRAARWSRCSRAANAAGGRQRVPAGGRARARRRRAGCSGPGRAVHAACRRASAPPSTGPGARRALPARPAGCRRHSPRPRRAPRAVTARAQTERPDMPAGTQAAAARTCAQSSAVAVAPSAARAAWPSISSRCTLRGSWPCGVRRRPDAVGAELPGVGVVGEAALERVEQVVAQRRVLDRRRPARRACRGCAASGRPSRCRRCVSPSRSKA